MVYRGLKPLVEFIQNLAFILIFKRKLVSEIAGSFNSFFLNSDDNLKLKSMLLTASVIVQLRCSEMLFCSGV